MTNYFVSQDFRLWVMVFQTRDTMWALRERELEQYGLSAVEMNALFIIQAIEKSQGKRATPLEISRWLFRKPHSVSGLLKRMAKKGLVTKTRDASNRKSVIVTITDKGIQAYKSVTRNGQSINRVISVLSQEERRQIWTLLGKLRDKALGEYGMESKLPFPHVLREADLGL